MCKQLSEILRGELHHLEVGHYVGLCNFNKVGFLSEVLHQLAFSNLLFHFNYRP